jgi:NADPH:quinone reductase-like Zn-dependent oxidoreductase
MRAVVHDRYGPPEVQRLEDVEQPVPKDDEVRIKVHVTSVTRSDCALRAAEPFFSRAITGFVRPKQRILGSEFSGEIDAVGATVSEFRVGDRVFGINPWRLGAHAEFLCMPAKASVTAMPAGMTFEDAGAVCDGATLALNALRPARLRNGRSILIFGASGAIGTAAVQLSSSFGATITAVCTTKNFELVRSLGADDVIDYTQEDFTKNGQTYDVILDAVGQVGHQSFTSCIGSLKRGGMYIPTDGLRNLAMNLWPGRIRGRRLVMVIPPRFTKQDVVFLRQLIEAGNYRAVIDRRYALEQVVEATRYVETKQKTGNVVLTVSES